jgi:polysaccharide export outer membrane protein
MAAKLLNWAARKAVWLLFLAGTGFTGPVTAQPRPTPPADPGNLPVQRIGVDDLLGVSVYDSPDLSRTVRVGADGSIRLPLVKRKISAAGLFPLDLEASIAKVLREDEVMVDPVVTVSVVEYRSRPISVAGSVKQPVTFQAFGQVTLLDALNRAGGLADEAGPEILVSRAQAGADGRTATLVQRIAVKALMDGTDAELNLRLEGGEEVRVPEAGRVYVMGNVKKPGSFPIRDTTETSVFRLLALSEGLMPYAARTAFIYRREGNGSRNEIPIELDKIMQRKSPDVPLVANDVLYIPDNKSRRVAMTALDRAATFGAGTVSGLLIWRR